MLTGVDLALLSVAEKRLVARALLAHAVGQPRSFPLSFAQEQLWFMDQLQPGSPVYNIPLYLPFEGACDVGALQLALEEMTARHDMLRVHFDVVDGGPTQIVEPLVPVELAVEDLTRLAAHDRHDALARVLAAELRVPFDLRTGCVRYRLIRVDPHNHLLSVTVHHIASDAWSLGIYVTELRALYEARRAGRRDDPLPPLELEYSDYAQWQRATLRGDRLRRLVAYWASRLDGAPPVLRLPTDHSRPRDQTFRGGLLGFVLRDEVSEQVISVSRDLKATSFMVLLAAYYALLYRCTGQEDIVVGAPVANRGNAALEPVIGLFVNTLVFRVRVDDADTFASVLARVSQAALEGFEHQGLPFDKLVDALHTPRLPGYPPVYQVVFNFQNASLIDSAHPAAEGETMAAANFPVAHSNTAKVDFNLTVTQNGERFSGGVEYNTDLFEADTVEGLIASYVSVVEAVVAEPDIRVVDIPLGADQFAPFVDLEDDGAEFSFEMEG